MLRLTVWFHPRKKTNWSKGVTTKRSQNLPDREDISIGVDDGKSLEINDNNMLKAHDISVQSINHRVRKQIIVGFHS